MTIKKCNSVKIIILILFPFICSLFSVQSQVTIGSESTPLEGTLLDLKENITKGNYNTYYGRVFSRYLHCYYYHYGIRRRERRFQNGMGDAGTASRTLTYWRLIEGTVHDANRSSMFFGDYSLFKLLKYETKYFQPE